MARAMVQEEAAINGAPWAMRMEHVSKSFRQGLFSERRIRAVEDVSFEIEKGKTVGLLGDSGCGKSTIAKLLMRMEKPDEGKILLEGRDVAMEDRRQSARRIQMIFQQPEGSFDPEICLEKSMVEPMEIHGLYSGLERRHKVLELMGSLNLPENLLSKFPHQISGGEAQRLAIVRALTLEPKILILDEATSMLDVSTQAQILNGLKELQKEKKLTYLFITHDPLVAKWMCDEILYMENGRLLPR